MDNKEIQDAEVEAVRGGLLRLKLTRQLLTKFGNH
jgi:hypothetical protein